MGRSVDPFLIRWQSLSETQRRFLRSAYEIDRELPHSSGLCKVIPLIKWRTVGAMCGLRATESDEVARSLADLNLIMIADQFEQRRALICGTSMYFMLADERRRQWRWVDWIVGAAIAAIWVWLVKH